jgi:hypothetical protein
LSAVIRQLHLAPMIRMWWEKARHRYYAGSLGSKRTGVLYSEENEEFPV